MITAKVFENGESQAIRLPKECRFSKWSSFMQAIDMFSDDFMENERPDEKEQEREEL